MYLPKDASRSRIREAQKARENRAEIVRALSHGQITRRELFRWGLFTSSGLLAWKNGLSVYAPSAYGQVPTGTPRSPLFGARKFTQPIAGCDLQTPIPLTQRAGEARISGQLGRAQRQAGRPTTRISMTGRPPMPDQPTSDNPYCNPITKRGPMEGRPPGESSRISAGTSSSPRSATSCRWAQMRANHGFHPNLP